MKGLWQFQNQVGRVGVIPFLPRPEGEWFGSILSGSTCLWKVTTPVSKTGLLARAMGQPTARVLAGSTGRPDSTWSRLPSKYFMVGAARRVVRSVYWSLIAPM